MKILSTNHGHHNPFSRLRIFRLISLSLLNTSFPTFSFPIVGSRALRGTQPHVIPMFFIVTIREVVSLNVRDANYVSAALKARLEDLHVGRVLRGAGLVMRVDSLKAMGDALVDQTCHIPVIADLIVFRPFIGQIINGTIVSSDSQGIKGIYILALSSI